jgi:outer membrane protein
LQVELDFEFRLILPTKNMTKKTSIFLLLISAFLLPSIALAKTENLMDAYYLGLANDPTFKSQYEVWMASRENIPIARANLLPQINFTGSQTRYYNQNAFYSIRPEPDTKYYNNNTSYDLNITQPIFNFAYWSALLGAKASVKATTATFSYATQEFITRVATAYFAVLQAQDILYFTQAEKKAVYETLVQTKHKYDVGLLPITGVNEAQASYDTIVATEITNKTDLENKKEQLRVITGTTAPVKFLDTLEIAVPLIKPNPTNMEQWVKTAEGQNYQILATRYNAIAANENIKQQAAGHLPVINAEANYSYSYDSNSGGITSPDPSGGIIPGFSRSKIASAGLSVNVPIFSGGQVTASTIQAEHSYQKAVSDEDFSHKNVASLTRQSYMNVVSGINKVLANKEAIKSKASSLRSTILSYEAGMRTMVDVLKAESDLYNAKKQYSISQYDYMLQILFLKLYAGTLSPQDLKIVNSWLIRSAKMQNSEQTKEAYADDNDTPMQNTVNAENSLFNLSSNQRNNTTATTDNKQNAVVTQSNQITNNSPNKTQNNTVVPAASQTTTQDQDEDDDGDEDIANTPDTDTNNQDNSAAPTSTATPNNQKPAAVSNTQASNKPQSTNLPPKKLVQNIKKLTTGATPNNHAT